MSVAFLNKLTDSSEDIFSYALAHGFEDIHFKYDPISQLFAIIVIHNTKLGPALGGTRCLEYACTDDALYDALRLAKSMSYKSALVGLPFGGGKAVCIKPANSIDRAAYFKAFGQFVDELGGRFITAVDSGTTLQDMDIVAKETDYVAATSKSDGAPSAHTAMGIKVGIEAAVKYKLGRDSLDGVHVAIQGIGKVGYYLCQELHNLGVKLTLADINQDTVLQCVEEFGAFAVSPDQILYTDCDVLSPCALGGVLNEDSIKKIKAPIIAGSANNQLRHDYHGKQLHLRGICYAPDFVINAGGLIFAASRYLGNSQDNVIDKIHKIHDSLLNIFERSHSENIPSNEIANTIAEELLS